MTQVDPKPNDDLQARVHLATGRILWVTAALVGLIAGAILGIWFALSVWVSERPLQQAGTQWEINETAPGVQPNQAFDREQYQRQLQRRLNEYRWEDAGRSHANIPIERAMELMAERQLRSPWNDATPGEDTDE